MTPTPEQLAALQEFAEMHGRYWKACLKASWQLGYSNRDKPLVPLLQQIRNQFGPEWLSKFKLNN